MITIEVHSRLESCADALNTLARATPRPNPFLDPRWLAIWWKRHGGGRTLAAMLCREEGKPVGAAPFYCESRGRFSALEYRLIGHGTSNYLDIVGIPGKEDVVVDTVFDHIAASNTSSIVVLHDINDRFSQCYKAVRRRQLDTGGSVASLYPCPLAAVGPEWQSYFERQRTGKSRKNLRHAEAQLSKLGAWRFREVGDPDEAVALFPRLARLHRERFSDTVNQVFDDGAFWQAALRECLPLPLSLSIVELDGVPVSFLIGFRMGDAFIDYAPAFDPALAKASVGQVHLMHLIRHKLEEGCGLFDFSKGEAAYKRWWSNDETTNYRFTFQFNLGPLARRYADGMNALVALAVRGRRGGYNARVKRLAGHFRRVWRSPNADRSIFVTREPAADDVTWAPWSYALVADLPEAARAEVVDRVIGSNGRSCRIAFIAPRTVLLSADTGDPWTVRY